MSLGELIALIKIKSGQETHAEHTRDLIKDVATSFRDVFAPLAEAAAGPYRPLVGAVKASMLPRKIHPNSPYGHCAALLTDSKLILNSATEPQIFRLGLGCIGKVFSDTEERAKRILWERRCESNPTQEIAKLYTILLEFSGRALRQLSRPWYRRAGRDTVKWDGWTNLLKEFRSQSETLERAIRTWKDATEQRDSSHMALIALIWVLRASPLRAG